MSSVLPPTLPLTNIPCLGLQNTVAIYVHIPNLVDWLEGWERNYNTGSHDPAAGVYICIDCVGLTWLATVRSSYTTKVFQTGRLSFPPRVSSLCRILYSPFSFDPQFGRFVSSILICPSVVTLGYMVGIYPR